MNYFKCELFRNEQKDNKPHFDLIRHLIRLKSKVAAGEMKLFNDGKAISVIWVYVMNNNSPTNGDIFLT